MPFEVVPGIPAAIGGLAYAGVPITYPDAGDVVDLIRGHEGETDSAADVDWEALARSHGTLVCYAGRAPDRRDGQGARRARPQRGRDARR